MKRSESWMLHYKELKSFVAKNGHYPKRDTKLYNWCRYNVKLKNKGKQTEEKAQLLDEVDAMRTRKKMENGLI